MSTQAEPPQPRDPQAVIAQPLGLGSQVQAFINKQPIALVGTITSKKATDQHGDVFFVRWDSGESGWYTAEHLLNV